MSVWWTKVVEKYRYFIAFPETILQNLFLLVFVTKLKCKTCADIILLNGRGFILSITKVKNNVCKFAFKISLSQINCFLENFPQKETPIRIKIQISKSRIINDNHISSVSLLNKLSLVT